MLQESTATRPAPAAPLIFCRPSRTGGPDHTISVAVADLTPAACSCAAGARGLVCWAVLDLAASTQLRDLAIERWEAARGVDQLTTAAVVYGKVIKNRLRAIAELERRQQRIEAQRFGLTDLGRDMVARIRAWDWLGITPSASPEPTAPVSVAVAA